MRFKRSEGLTPSEKILADLCDNSFLKLTYPDIRDWGHVGGSPMNLFTFRLAAGVTFLAGTAPAVGKTGQFTGTYLCTAEASGGVAYNGGKWVGTSFQF